MMRREQLFGTVSLMTFLQPLKQRLIDVTSFRIPKSLYPRSVLFKSTSNFGSVWIAEVTRLNSRNVIFLLQFFICCITLIFPSTFLDNDKLDTNSLYFTIRLLQPSTCFEHYMLIIRRLNCIVAASGIVTLSQWLSGAQVERELSTCAPDGH